MSTNAPFTAADGWFKGEAKGLVFSVVDANGAAVSISGWTIQFRMADVQGGSADITKSATLTTPASGICTVTIAAADTSGLLADDWYYTLERTNAGSEAVLAYGTITLLDKYVA